MKEENTLKKRDFFLKYLDLLMLFSFPTHECLITCVRIKLECQYSFLIASIGVAGMTMIF